MRIFSTASERHQRQQDDEGLYTIAAAEVLEGRLKPGVVAKAFADSGGNEEKAKALYVEYRVRALRIERDAIIETAKARQHEELRARQAALAPLPPDPVWEAIKPGRKKETPWGAIGGIAVLLLIVVFFAQEYGWWTTLAAGACGLGWGGYSKRKK